MSLKSNQSDIFSTSDLGCTTAIALFYPVLSVDKTNPQKAEFLFKRNIKLDKLVESYWSNTLKVSPLEYFQKLKVMKSRLYEQG